MYIQIINFQLKDLTEQDYQNICNELAPSFAEVPGLVSKTWLANPETNTYGGVYLWKDRQAMEAFTKTELFKTVASHPNLADITSKDFEVMDEPSRVTRGYAAA